MAEENPIKEGAEKVESALKSEPWYVWAGAAAAAGVIVYFVWKRKQASGSAASSQGQNSAMSDLNGAQLSDIAGLPYGSEDVSGYNYQAGPVDNFPGGTFSEVGVNGEQVPIIPAGMTPIYDSNGNLVGFQEPGQQTTQSPSPAPPPVPTPGPSPVPTPGPGPVSKSMKTIASGAIASVPGGTNVGGKNIGTVPAGADVTVLQGPQAVTIKGVVNHYYQIAYKGITGWVNAKDFGGMGGGGIPDNAAGFHLAVNAGRNTIDQWTFANGMHQDFHSYASEVN